MTRRCVVLDQMIRDLGALKIEATLLSQPPCVSMPVAAGVQGAIDQVAEALHLYLDSHDGRAIVGARLAIEQARAHVDQAAAVIRAAGVARRDAQELRRHAAVRHETAKPSRRVEQPPIPDPGPSRVGDHETGEDSPPWRKTRMPAWATFDQLLRQLGEARVASGRLADDTSPEAVALREALDQAAGALHAALDDDEVLEGASVAVRRVLDAVSRSGVLLRNATAARQLSEKRSEAARKREAGKLLRRSYRWTPHDE